jgi:hypothetical protein
MSAVGADDVAPLLGRHFLKAVVAHDGCVVVDEDIEPATLRLDAAEHALDLVVVGDVTPQTSGQTLDACGISAATLCRSTPYSPSAIAGRGTH